MRIIFMGTPGFAVPVLDILVENGYEVAGVVTAPDRPAGRGQRVAQPAVKKYAEGKGLAPILQPEKLNDPDFIGSLQSLKPDLFVVVAFRILPPQVFNLPPKGTINLHASLLPKYRGAAPINWAVIQGEKETGVTTFFIDRQVDTGEILEQEKMAVAPDMTAGELHDELMEKGAQLVLRTVQKIEDGTAVSRPQPRQAQVEKAPKIFTKDCQIDFHSPVEAAYNFIRGLSPYPAAWMVLDGKRFKIYRAKKEKCQPHQQPGKVVLQDGQLKIAFPDGYILPTQVQLEGKKQMPVGEFLKGYGPWDGDDGNNEIQETKGKKRHGSTNGD